MDRRDVGGVVVGSLDGIRGGPQGGARVESRALTGLRGVGAVLVMLHHFYLMHWMQRHGPVADGLMRRGYLGVDLFFVLSGFVIAMAYGEWFPGRFGRVAQFLFRRAARLWPLHVVVLVVTTALLMGRGDVISPRTFLVNVAMVQAWGISREINPPAWSASAECFAYLMFPLLAGPVLRGRFGAWLGAGLVVALLATALAYAPAESDERRGALDIYYNYSVLPVLRCLAGFTLGLVTWRLGQVAAVARAVAAGLVGPLGLMLMLMLMLAGAHDLMIYPLLPLIVLGLHLGRGWWWRGLATGPVYRVGVLSYSLYLVHYVMLCFLPFGSGPDGDAGGMALVAFLLATGCVAGLAHVTVEMPVRRAMRAAGDAALVPLGRRAAAVAAALQPGRGSIK